MKQSILLVFICMFMVNYNSAQTTITIDNFPVAGDTLVSATDGMPFGIIAGNSGANQTWDFRSLQGLSNTTVYQNAAAGQFSDNFPNADLVILGLGETETYYRTTANSFDLLGFYGNGGIDLAPVVEVKYTPPSKQRVAPLTYGDNYTNNTSLLVPFAGEDIPPEFRDSLPFVPDSIRLNFATTSTTEVDAWGVAQIPGGSYEVIRAKTIEISDTKLEVKISNSPFIPWVEIPAEELPFLGFLGKDTTKTYSFLSDLAKEPIAELQVNPEDDSVEFVTYKSNDVVSNVSYLNTGRPDLLVYPNPAIDHVRFELLNLPIGKYKIRVYNLLGQTLWQETHQVSSTKKTVRVNFSKFQKGTYLYSLTNDRGKTITTKRLVIIRP